MTARFPALPPPITEQAVDADGVWSLYLWIAYGVAALVAILMVWVIVRYRRRTDDLPPQKHYNIPVEVLYTILPLLAVVGLFAASFSTIRAIDRTEEAPDLVVDVVAFQWQWEFAYPASGVRVAGTDTTEPVLVLPASSTVRFDMTSRDVIHSFWLTPFRFKRDIIPGRPASFSVNIGDAAGSYPNAGVCAEFCGLDHALMRFSLLVLEPAEFAAWLAEQPTDSPVVVEEPSP
ncbi:MAG: cytochrome c oxidase subunit II [Ilumatobacteraceae bacterium]